MKYQFITGLAHHLGRPITILDTETTGLGSAQDTGIVDFGCITIKPDGDVIPFETLLKPHVPLTPGASGIHGIWPEDLIGAPKFDLELSKKILLMYEDHVISGFNSFGYDNNIIRHRMASAMGCPVDDIPMGDHLDVRLLWTNGNQYGKGKLVDVAAHYDIKVENAHRAMGDVIMTAGILDAMISSLVDERQDYSKVLRHFRGNPFKREPVADKPMSSMVDEPKAADTPKPKQTSFFNFR